VDLVKTTAEGWPDEESLCDRVADPSVKALAISLVQFSSGYKANIARLGQACRENDCFLVVDGIQGIGQTSFDVKETPVDFVACGGQKWLLSPFGSGFVYVRGELLQQLEPTFVGWLAFDGTDDYSKLTKYEYILRGDARRFEVNTLPFQDLIGMNESVKLLLDFGLEDIELWLRQVKQPVVDAAQRGNLRIVSPHDSINSSGIVCVEPTRLAECFERFQELGVAVALREGAIRISPHCYNTPDEMEKVVAIFSEFA
jgi:selenocysteine lyase/cysteine desulfurase